MQIYEPAEDSFLLSDALKKMCRRFAAKKDARFLDIGAGSGIVSETALNSGFKKENITASDINRKALKLLRQKGFKTVYSDLFERVDGRFDLIAFNAPYLPYNRHDRRKDTCGGKKGYETSIRFVEGVGKHLKKGGIALILISSLTSPEIIKKEIRKKGFRCRTIGSKKLFFESLFVLAVFR